MRKYPASWFILSQCCSCPGTCDSVLTGSQTTSHCYGLVSCSWVRQRGFTEPKPQHSLLKFCTLTICDLQFDWPRLRLSRTFWRDFIITSATTYSVMGADVMSQIRCVVKIPPNNCSARLLHDQFCVVAKSHLISSFSQTTWKCPTFVSRYFSFSPFKSVHLSLHFLSCPCGSNAPPGKNCFLGSWTEKN